MHAHDKITLKCNNNSFSILNNFMLHDIYLIPVNGWLGLPWKPLIFKMLWLIDIEYVRSIIYNILLSPINNGL
jgi:hypothetical protein